MTGPNMSPAVELQAFLRSRRTTHDFLPDPVPEATLERALQCALRAPNHHLTNPWRFRLLGPEAREAVAQANAELVRERHGPEAAGKKLERWRAIPGWLLVTSLRDTNPQRERENYAACCCAVQNLMLALHAEDIGSKWTSGAVTQGPEFPRLLGYSPEQEEFVGLLWYGYPGRLTEPTRRRALSEVYSRLP